MKKIWSIGALMAAASCSVMLFQNCGSGLHASREIQSVRTTPESVRTTIAAARQVSVRNGGFVSSSGDFSEERNGFDWNSDYINKAYLSLNPWAFTRFGDNDGWLQWFYPAADGSDNTKLKLRWFVGGVYRDYGGNYFDGWDPNTQTGGNNVKAYPRIGIGTASGQETATSGAPNVVSKDYGNGTIVVDQNVVRELVGLPARIRDLNQIDINVTTRFSEGYPGTDIDEEERYGNFYFAIDSYLHDVDDRMNLENDSLFIDDNGDGRNDTYDGINDSSGTIYGRQVSQFRGITKKWAIMIWYHKPLSYETSGGIYLLPGGGTVNIDGQNYLVKVKTEKASIKKFSYISFVMDRTTVQMASAGRQPRIRYKEFLNYVLSNNFRNALNNLKSQAQIALNRINSGSGVPHDGAGPFQWFGQGSQERLNDLIAMVPPTQDYVLSDLNVGVEVSANPDTPGTANTPHPVAIEFDELSFNINGNVSGYTPGFTGTGNTSPASAAAQAPVVANSIPAAPQNTSSNCRGTGRSTDQYGLNGDGICLTNGGGHVEMPIEALSYLCGFGVASACQEFRERTGQDRGTDNCVDNAPFGDGWGWNGVSACRVASDGGGNGGTTSTGGCPDTDPVGDGWGWNGTSSCRVGSASIDDNTGSSSSSADCEDTAPVGDGWGWNGTSSCRVGSGAAYISTTGEKPNSNGTKEDRCVDTEPVGDGWGTDTMLGVECELPSAASNQVESPCIDTAPAGDGWGWNGVSSCRL